MILALLLGAPALWTGLHFDDHVLRANLAGEPRWTELRTPAWDLFHFYPDPATSGPSLVAQGLAPWWAHPGMHARFFRPLSSLTHWLDFRLAAEHPWIMHLHSLLWYALLCGLAAMLYRRLIPTPWIAGLAALLFAVDHTHSVIAGWIANRNALIAAAPGVAALLCHHAWRARGHRGAAWAAPLLLAVALAGGEAALGAAAYLLAYAVCLERGGALARLRTLWPYALVGAGWVAVYLAGDFGVKNSGLYLDPVAQPGAYLRALPVHAALLGGGALGGPPPDFWLTLSPAGRGVMLGIALLVLIVAALALAPLLRRDRVARFFAVGALASLLPVCATFPSSRLLLLPSLGFLGLVAMLIAAVLDRAAWLPRRRLARAPALALALLAGASHLVLSPLLFSLGTLQMAAGERMVTALNAGIADEPRLASQRLVIAGAPDALVVMYLLVQRSTHGRVLPRGVTMLGVNTQALDLERIDERTLLVRADAGFYRDDLSILTRPPGVAMPPGTGGQLGDVSFEVVEANAAGVPTAARFRFGAALEDPSLRWLTWDGHTLVPLAPPAPGERLRLPARKLTLMP